MNKIIGALALGLIITGTQFASRSDCFRPYRVQLTNNSGGVGTIQKTNGISGLSRKTEMENNTSVTIMIKKLGAEIKVLAGPEGNKSMREIEFYCKEPNVFSGHVTLNPKGVTTTGFYTENKPYDVKIVNESGGNLQILDSVGVIGADRNFVLVVGKTINVTVHPGAFMIVQSGPENRKVNHRINFAEQTGTNPTVLVTKRGFTNRGIVSTNVEIKTQRLPVFRGIRRPYARMAAQAVVIEKMRKGKRNNHRREAVYARGVQPA